MHNKMAMISNNSISLELMAALNKQCLNDRIKSLYPMVNEEDTPLPRQWSPKDRYSYLGLTQNNLRVHYKGSGKNHKDAASVRASHSIPAACGIYYFEVKVISKGRDGYMGIGLSVGSVSLNRLPGWDKFSYGYHGDDGNSFCCSGTGQPYGPTFTTGDIIGCCINLIDGSCFYTKNGTNLGIAFRDLPPNLFPTVGLQTPGEVIEANFGQSPFIFNIADYVKEWEMKTRMKIENFSIPNAKGEWQMALQKVVITYLIHHGYYATAKAFADCTRQQFDEDKSSIQNRQKIQSLILNGKIGEAIAMTEQFYPGLLENNKNLLFTLKCRQFIEMVNGTDIDNDSKFNLQVAGNEGERSVNSNTCSSHKSASAAPFTTPARSSSASTSSANFRTGYQPQQQENSSSNVILPKTYHSNGTAIDSVTQTSLSEEAMNSSNLAMNGRGKIDSYVVVRPSTDSEEEDDMDVMEIEDSSEVNGMTNGACLNGQDHFDGPKHMYGLDLDQSSTGQHIYAENHAMVERILHFGRELHAMGEQMKREFGENEVNSKALKDAFSLLAYSDPWNSPVGHQLNPIQREPVCTALNSAILELQGFPKQPPLEIAIAHTTECLKLMSKAGIGSCAFASISDALLL